MSGTFCKIFAVSTKVDKANATLVYKSSQTSLGMHSTRRRYKQLYIGMKQHFNHSAPPPNIDTRNLKKNEVIRLRYDRKGNLIEVSKEDRNNGCLVWPFLIVALAIVYWLW